MRRYVPPGLGWQRDLPDPRDYAPGHERIRPLLASLRQARSRTRSVSWHEYFPPVDCQLGLGSCAAHAGVALVAYFERRAFGKLVEGSRLFLYQMARLLQHGLGDCGAGLRQTWKALVRFGLPPEEFCPYQVERLENPPDPHLFSFATEYRSLLYVRLDRVSGKAASTLTCVKSFLTAGFPVAFGFTVFDSLLHEAQIPFPTCYDAALGGQAAVALGYDDDLRIHSERGALRVRSSWSADWGEAGYGWRGTQWAVFEPNDEPLWGQLRLNIGVFMHDLFRQGAFQGSTPKDAYFVKCDKETTTQSDINRGVVNVVVGFAPLKPAEFVVIQLQQMAGQLDV